MVLSLLRLGADDSVFIDNDFIDALEANHKDYFDIIICTLYIRLLRSGGSKLHIVGNINLISSNVGGLHDTKEMLHFCAEHNITADIAIVRPD